MLLEPDSPRRTDEERRYFPDWTPTLIEIHEEIEADHNSYLAGGYAEEFGYHAQPGSSRGVLVLDGEAPEDCAEWQAEAGAMHPGYPIRPRPIPSDSVESESGTTATFEQPRTVASRETSIEMERESGQRGTFFRVTERLYERERHHAQQRTVAIFTRLLAALVAFRWALPHTRHGRNGAKPSIRRN